MHWYGLTNLFPIKVMRASPRIWKAAKKGGSQRLPSSPVHHPQQLWPQSTVLPPPLLPEFQNWKAAVLVVGVLKGCCMSFGVVWQGFFTVNDAYTATYLNYPSLCPYKIYALGTWGDFIPFTTKMDSTGMKERRYWLPLALGRWTEYRDAKVKIVGQFFKRNVSVRSDKSWSLARLFSTISNKRLMFIDSDELVLTNSHNIPRKYILSEYKIHNGLLYRHTELACKGVSRGPVKQLVIPKELVPTVLRYNSWLCN